MTELDEWVATASKGLGLTDPVDIELLLDIAREAAHGVQKVAAPITTYLLGLAVGRGADPAEAAATLRQVLADSAG
ncbi:MAG: DUF6457 domain-containing protein [Mycobacteriales bacterium]